MKIVGKILNLTLALTCVYALATEPQAVGAKAVPAAESQSSPRVDNTDINERDKGGATKTPQDQTNKTQDRQLLAEVRRAIVRDKSLSTKAHNVKILVEGGAVTLRGPVKNAGEKTKVEALAKNVNGITSTDNQLDVKTTASAR